MIGRTYFYRCSLIMFELFAVQCVCVRFEICLPVDMICLRFFGGCCDSKSVCMTGCAPHVDGESASAIVGH